MANKAFRRILVAGALLSLVTVSDAFIYLIYQDRTDMQSTSFPLLFVGTALAYLLLAVPLGRLADRIGRAPVFIAGHVVLIGCYLVLRTSGSGLRSRPRDARPARARTTPPPTVCSWPWPAP